MTEAAFTPGPWLIHSRHRWIVPAEDAFKSYEDALPICQLRDPDERLTEDETLANGFLIAAAPELFAALKHILNGALSLPRFAEEEARAAIAKARGQHG